MRFFRWLRNLFFSPPARVENFLIDLTIDGETRTITTKGRRGSFVMTIYQRNAADYGMVPWEIGGYAHPDGELTLTIGRGKLDGQTPQYFKTKTHR